MSSDERAGVSRPFGSFKGEIKMKRALSLLIIFSMLCVSFSLNIYPILNQLTIKPGDEKIVTIRLTGGRYPEKVKIEPKDFAIVSKNYVYDLPGYPYSIKPFIEIPYDEVDLLPGEVIDLPVKISIPRDFTGAQAFGSIFFSVSGGVEGGVIYLLNLVSIFILDIENQRKTEMILSDVQFFDLASEGCPKELVSIYGDFGTVVKMRVKNPGNMVLAVSGEVRFVSRDLGRIVATIPLERETFVVFPSFEEEFVFFTNVLLPPGKMSIQIEGVSQGIRLAKSFETIIEQGKTKEKAVRIEPSFKLFDATKMIAERFQIHNLTPEKFQVELSVKEPLEITPKQFTLAPYSSMNFYFRYDPKKVDLPDGDSVFTILPSSEGKLVKTLGTGMIALRKNIIEPSYEQQVSDYFPDDNKVVLQLKNTGNMVMEFSIVEKEPYRTTILSENIVLLPGENKILRFSHNLPLEFAKNAILLRSRIYQTEEWKEERLNWKE